MDPDFTLLEQWRGGDRDVGNELFERHFQSLVRFFHNKIPSQTQDAMQKTFLVCVESRDKFEGRGSFRAYLFGVAHNVLRNHIRALVRERERFGGGITSAYDADPSASRLVAQGQNRRLLLEALRRLPLDLQVVLELFYWEELSGEELAAVLDIPLGTVRSRVRRGREKLEAILEELATSPQQLEETRTQLEDWARQLRDAALPPE